MNIKLLISVAISFSILSLNAQNITTEADSENIKKNEFGVKINSLTSSAILSSTMNFMYKRKIGKNYLRIETLNIQYLKRIEDDFGSSNYTLENYVLSGGIQIGYEIRKPSGKNVNFYYGPYVKYYHFINVTDYTSTLDVIPPIFETKSQYTLMSAGIGGILGLLYNIPNSAFYVFGELTPFAAYEIQNLQSNFQDNTLNSDKTKSNFNTVISNTGFIGIMAKF